MIHLIDEMKYDAQTTSNFLDLLDFEVSVWHAEDKDSLVSSESLI